MVLALICALVATACGAHWNDAQKADIAARYAVSDADEPTGAEPGAGEPVGDGPTATTAPAVGSDPTAGNEEVAAGEPDAGGGQSDGDGGPDDPAGPLPCTDSTDAAGVSDEQVVVGAVSSLSGPVPGLGTTFEAGVRAHVAYRNATGGVCGREVSLRSTDDGGDPATNRNAVSELDAAAVGIMTGPAGGSDGGVRVASANDTPMVGIAINENLDSVPSFFNINPRVADTSRVLGKYRWLVEQGVTQAAVVYVEQGAQEAGTQRDLMRSAGIEVVLDRSFSVANFSYDSLARAVANSEADYLYFLHEFGAAASMAQSMADTGYELLFHENVTAYGTDYIDLAGDAAEGTINWLFTLPVEDGDANQELTTLRQWMGQVAPGMQIDVFAAEGWAAAKVFVDSLEALAGPIARDAILAELSSIGDYDADGLIAPIDFSQRRPSGCLVGMVVDGGQWRRLVPTEGFLC